MTEKKIEQGDLQKALTTLQDLAKGHASRGAPATEVATMVGESGSTQLYHTPSDSDPGGWAGTSEKEEGWEDHVGQDGTDYQAQGKMAKSILAKLAKGQQLTANEVSFIAKGGMDFLKKKDDDKDEDKAEKAGMMGMPPVRKAADHDDEEEDKKMVHEMVKPGSMKKSDVKKSFLDHASENNAVTPGFEVSEFLAGFAQVMHKSLQSMEARITDRILTSLSQNAEEQGSVQKSMAEALAGLGEVLSVQAQRLDQVEAAPARAPKSQLSVVKSLRSPADGGNETAITDLTKSQINEKLMDLVKSGKATQQDVLKFDATGEISTSLAQKVMAS